MKDEQTFQKPWQRAFLKAHAIIEKAEAKVRSLLPIHPNTQPFQDELKRKPALVLLKNS